MSLENQNVDPQAPVVSSPGGGPGEGGTPAPSSSPESDSNGEMDSLIETLRYDPFKGGPKPQTKAAPANASPGVAPPRSDQPPAATQPVAPEGVSGTPAGAAPQSADALSLAADRLTQAADRLTQAPTTAQTGQQPQDEIPPYLYDIPPQLVDALSSENPQQRQAALQHLVAGTARAVHTNMVKAINELKASFPQLISQNLQAHTYRENVRRDFYSKYPMLDNPHLAPTVASVTQQVMNDVIAQGGRPSWSPQLAQAIAERVFQLIPGLKVQAAPQPTLPPHNPKPPQIFTPGSRPAQSGGIEADIVDTLFG